MCCVNVSEGVDAGAAVAVAVDVDADVLVAASDVDADADADVLVTAADVDVDVAVDVDVDVDEEVDVEAAVLVCATLNCAMLVVTSSHLDCTTHTSPVSSHVTMHASHMSMALISSACDVMLSGGVHGVRRMMTEEWSEKV